MQLSNLSSPSEDLHLQYNQQWTSRNWLKQKYQPDMLKHCRGYVILVLETGLMFKEDSLSLEDALIMEDAISPDSYRVKGFFLQSLLPKFTSGEKLLAAIAMGVCIASVPLRIPIFRRGNLIRMACWTCVSVSAPLLLRRSPPKHISELLELMKEYTTLVRRGIARTRDNNALGRNSRSPPSEAMARLLIAQQKELCSILHTHTMFLRTECLDWSVSGQHWEDLAEFSTQLTEGNLTIIHNQYLLVQSTYLRILASVHLPIALRTMRMTQDKNTKLYILHASILPQLIDIYQTHVYTLKSAHAQHKKYQKLNIEDVTRKPFINLNENNNSKDSWQFSEMHNSTIILSSELKNALQKCLELDGFLDACWNTKSKFSSSMLEDDLNKLKTEVFKCVSTIESMEIKIKKIKNAEVKLLEMALQKLPLPAVEEEDDVVNIRNVSEDTLLPIEDQVFYFVKNQENSDDAQPNRADDYLSAPGVKEIAATKAVLGELRVKLVEREEIMRERERKALINTMPEFQGNVPEFPRQMGKEFVEKNSQVESDKAEDKTSAIDSLSSNGSGKCVNMDQECGSNLIKNGNMINPLDLSRNTIINSGTNSEIGNIKTENINNSETELYQDKKMKTNDCDSCILLSDPSCSCTYNQIERNELLLDVRKYRAAKRQHKPSNYRCENFKSVDMKNKTSSDSRAIPSRQRKLVAIKKGNGKRGKAKSKFQHNMKPNGNDSSDDDIFNNVTKENSPNGIKNVFIMSDQSKPDNILKHVIGDSEMKALNCTDNKNMSNESNAISMMSTSDNFLKAESKTSDSLLSPESSNLDQNESTSSSSLSEEQPLEVFNKNVAFEKFDNVISKKIIDAVIESKDNSDSESCDVKKNHKRVEEFEDEGMKPTEYSFGTGMAIASLLQIPQNHKTDGVSIKFPTMACEEVFIGDGEVSDDSGNED